jgi:dTDP-4-dehydrorhamnose 3,5-epimerase-like enzyme
VSTTSLQSLPVRVVLLDDHGDRRGRSFSLPDGWHEFLGTTVDMHTATIHAGPIRGNHYHTQRQEIITVLYQDRWSLHWDSGAETEIHHQFFSGTGAVLIEVEPQASHAIKNDGSVDLHIISLSNRRYNPEHPDAYPRQVVK